MGKTVQIKVFAGEKNPAPEGERRVKARGKACTLEQRTTEREQTAAVIGRKSKPPNRARRLGGNRGEHDLWLREPRVESAARWGSHQKTKIKKPHPYNRNSRSTLNKLNLVTGRAKEKGVGAASTRL